MTSASEQTSASHVLTLINKIKEAQGGISNHQMSSRAIIEDLILPELHKLASGQPDELSKAATWKCIEHDGFSKKPALYVMKAFDSFLHPMWLDPVRDRIPTNLTHWIELPKIEL